MRPPGGPQFIDKGGTPVIDSLPRGPSWDLRVSAPGRCPGQREEESMGRLTRLLAAMAIVVLGVTACGTSNTAGGKIGGTVHILGTWHRHADQARQGREGCSTRRQARYGSAQRELRRGLDQPGEDRQQTHYALRLGGAEGARVVRPEGVPGEGLPDPQDLGRPDDASGQNQVRRRKALVRSAREPSRLRLAGKRLGEGDRPQPIRINRL